MSNKPLVVERTYNATPDRVWQALTDPEQMRQWYFDLADFRPEVGYEFEFAGCSESEEYIHLCRVLTVIPERKLTHSWTYKGYEGYSEVSWELFPEGSKTRVVLTHTGLESFPHKPDFAISSFSEGWTDFLHNKLESYLAELNVA